jgi:streptogramin lyase
MKYKDGTQIRRDKDGTLWIQKDGERIGITIGNHTHVCVFPPYKENGDAYVSMSYFNDNGHLYIKPGQTGIITNEV